MKPMISVVMISYNHQDFVEDALRSVIEQKSDKYDLEIFIVDDGSTDNTQEIIRKVQKEYPTAIHSTFKDHIGVKAINRNLNEQVARSNGEYVAFLAADDKFMPNSFEGQLDVFLADAAVDLVVSDGVNYEVKSGSYLGCCQDPYLLDLIVDGEVGEVYEYIISHVPALFIQGYLLKRDLINKIQGFDEAVIADDWVLNIRIFKYLLEQGRKAVYLEGVSFQRNLHGSNTSSNFEDQYLRIVQVIDKYVKEDCKKRMLGELYYSYIKISIKRLRINKFLKFLFKYIKIDPSLHALRHDLSKFI